MSKYKKIYKDLRNKIENREYKPGNKIPSMRKLAEEYGCNKLIVKKAFDLLKDNNLIEKKIGKGSFVKFPEKINSKKNIFDFTTSYITEDFFPYKKVSKLINNLIDKEKSSIFSQSNIKGDKNLINVLANKYNLPQKNMIIISGAQQGIDLSRKILNLRFSENIIFEDPTYSGAISLFRPKIFVTLENDGPSINELKQKINKKIKSFYTIPIIHNPTGINYSPEKKKIIASLAQKYNFYIIEDDYLSDFSENNTKRFVDIIPDKTIFIKSLSKITAPGIRLGFLVAPDSLVNKFLNAKFSSDIMSSTFMQKFLNIFIKSGLFDKHIHYCKTIIDKRKNVLKELINNYPFLNISNSQEGYNLWIKSDKPINLTNPPWADGSNFSFSKEYQDYFRISFMGIKENNFENSIKYLKTIFDGIEEESDQLVF
ncbi:MAG: PLP-dependent aminotransferase family protein [Candidatus Mcinerneyibacterium aminivorans]|uniref:PLP-dependent aminotransferase family protein n=1 Tax=Candidatus Mcinerneyibacterium aminivorans TaxID=2703815 RepID=A0A5D0MGM7_9BACT|nr:MAG: PLP-dependent aminotransferase family protein [Candidatus Mcinerneyibacterium aminivorans]